MACNSDRCKLTGGADCQCDRRRKLKVMASAMSALLFVVVSSPEAYAFVQKLLGRLVTVASPAGMPTAIGLAVHGLVYGLIVYALMG